MSSIYWTGGEARLKTYVVATRAKGGAVISLQIEVEDAHALGWLMRQIEEIRIEQDKVEKAAKVAERRAPGGVRRGQRALPADPHLTYRGGDS